MQDASGPPPQPREDRGPRIPPAKVTTINAEPTISIFYKSHKNATLELLDGKFPRDAAMIFCDRIRHDLMENNSKSFTIVGGDLTGLKEVLDWIKQCVSEGSIIKYRDVDDTTPNLLTAYANVIISAGYLGIPARDLADGLTKRMLGISRKVLMSWDEVEWFYSTPRLDAERWGLPVREVAGASVFWAWWNGKLDEFETPEDMMLLDVLRQKIPKLDEDLHAWCERNEEEVRKKWEEKRNNKAREMAGFGTDAGGGMADGADGFASSAVGGAVGEGWDTPGAAIAPDPNSSNWDSADAPAAAAGSLSASAFPLSDSGIDMAATNMGGKTTPSHGHGLASSSPATTFADNEHANVSFEDNVGGNKGDSVDWADEVNEEDELKAQEAQQVNQAW